MSDDKTNGWNEYSKLVLKELETLADGVDSLKKELQETRRDIAKLEARESKVDEIREWKQKMNDIITPEQLKDLIREHKQHRDFQIKSIAILGFIQLALTIDIVWKFFSK